MFLSIIIPVYNKEKYISECLDSCLKQDISCDDYEIICIDDKSTDKSGDILDKYLEKHQDKIRVIHKTQNGGVSAARNTGIEVAKGEYLYFLDADDFIENNILASVKDLTCTKPDTIFVGNYNMQSDLFTDEELTLKEEEKLPCGPHVLGCRFYKRSMIYENKIRYKEEISLAEDAVFDYEVQLAQKTVIHSDKIIHYYRTVKGSLLHRNRVDKIDSYIGLVKIYKDFVERKVDDKTFLEYHLFLRIHDCVNTIVRLPFKEWRKYIKILKDLNVYNIKPSKEAIGKFISKKEEGKPDTIDKTPRSFRLAATRMGFINMYLKVKLNKLFG